jgi:hypothetical protein
MRNEHSAFDHPMFPLVSLALLVYGVIAFEIWMLTIDLWVGIVWLLAVVIAGAVTIALGMSRILDEKSGADVAPARAEAEPEKKAEATRPAAPAPVLHPRRRSHARAGRGATVR